MAFPLTVPPKHGHKSFFYSKVVNDLDELRADIAFLGIPHGDPYLGYIRSLNPAVAVLWRTAQRPEPGTDHGTPGE